MGATIKKIFSDDVPLVYSLLHLQAGNEDYLVAASEEENGSAYAYNLNRNYEKQAIWQNIGGTMTMVQVSDSLDFLATQRFFPGFNAASCELVKLSFDGTGWNQTKIMDFPYLHRFDLIEGPDKMYFIGATITEHKEFSDDWRMPGQIYVGEYRQETNELIGLTGLDEPLVKNHGYCAFSEKGYSFVTSEEGVFCLRYPSAESDWQLTKVYDLPVSDIAAIDTDDDGKFNYYLVINNFHGQTLTILNDRFQAIKEISGNFPFAHSIWGGVFNGKACFVFGNREGKQDYYLLKVREEFGEVQVELVKIDEQVGSTNTTVFQKNQQDLLVSANREINQVAIYVES